MMLKQKLLIGILGWLLVVACSRSDDAVEVRSVIGNQRTATEAALVNQQASAQLTLLNTRAFDTGVYALIDTTLYRFGSDGSLQSATENVQQTWYIDGQMIEQRTDGLYVVPLGQDARKVIDLQPSDVIHTFSVAPTREYALLGFATERTASVPFGPAIPSEAKPYQRYVVVNLNTGAAFDVVYAGEDVEGFVLFQGVGFWTTNNTLLIVARLIPNEVEFDALETFPFRRLIHEIFTVDPVAAVTVWREDINITMGTFDYASQELLQSDLIRNGGLLYGQTLAPIQTAFDYGREIVQYQDDVLYASIQVATYEQEITPCTQRAIRRESLSRESGYVFLPGVLFQGPAAAFSNLWWYDDQVWFLRSYAPDCSTGQIDVVLMTAGIDETVQTVFTTSDTFIDPYGLILAPAPDARAVLWNSGDANNAYLMATYPDSRINEVIFRRPRTPDGRGVVAAGWLTAAPE